MPKAIATKESGQEAVAELSVIAEHNYAELHGHDVPIGCWILFGPTSSIGLHVLLEKVLILEKYKKGRGSQRLVSDDTVGCARRSLQAKLGNLTHLR
jgi:hypothetical protein